MDFDESDGLNFVEWLGNRKVENQPIILWPVFGPHIGHLRRGSDKAARWRRGRRWGAHDGRFEKGVRSRGVDSRRYWTGVKRSLISNSVPSQLYIDEDGEIR